MATQTVTITAPSVPVQAPQSALSKVPEDTKLPKIQKVPIFTDKLEERCWAKKQMAAAFRVFAKLGFCDGVAGHMSLRGEQTRLIW
jgi:hypothetical protein